MEKTNGRHYNSKEIDMMGYTIPLKKGLGFSGTSIKYFKGSEDKVRETIKDIAIKLKGKDYYEIAKSISYERPIKGPDKKNEKKVDEKDPRYIVLYSKDNAKIILSSKIEKILAKDEEDNLAEFWKELSDLNKDF